MKRTGLAILLAACTAFLGGGRLFADTIERVGSNIDNVDVVRETYKKVYYKLSDHQQEMDRKSAKVTKVVYENWPETWQTGHDALKNSDFEAAIADFEDVAKSVSEDMPQCRQYGLFWKAEAERKYAEAGNSAKFPVALKTYETLLKAEPETVHYASCLNGMGRCLIFMDKKAEALARFDQVLADEYVPDGPKISAKIGKAFVSEVEGKPRNALSEYQQILTEAERTAPDEACQVKVRIAVCKLKTDQYDQAMSDFNKILSDSSIRAEIRSEVRAAAYNGRGECYWKKREYEKGMLDFVRVIVLYESITSESPKAFYFASQCMTNMSSALDKAGKKDEAKQWRMRAKALSTELRTKFSGSEYANK